MRRDKKCRRCGCDEDAHRHFSGPGIRATWCGLCGCNKYKRPRWWSRRKPERLQIVPDR